MARTAITAQQITAAGLEMTTESANADGNSFVNDGNTILYVENGDASDITVTIQTPQQVAGLDVGEREITVTAGEARFIGNLATGTYNRPSGATDAGQVYVDYSAVTSVTVAVLEP